MSHNTAQTTNTPPATESAACAVAAPAAPAPGACAFDQFECWLIGIRDYEAGFGSEANSTWQFLDAMAALRMVRAFKTQGGR